MSFQKFQSSRVACTPNQVSKIGSGTALAAFHYPVGDVRICLTVHGMFHAPYPDQIQGPELFDTLSKAEHHLYDNYVEDTLNEPFQFEHDGAMVDYPSKALQLMKDGEFTLDQWVACFDGLHAAIAALEGTFEAGLDTVCLRQSAPDDEAVWDGGFAVVNDWQVWYIGSDGPSGGTGAERRVAVTPDSIIDVM